MTRTPTSLLRLLLFAVTAGTEFKLTTTTTVAVTDVHGLNSISNLRLANQLHTAFEHANKKIVVVADTGGSVFKDIASSRRLYGFT